MTIWEVVLGVRLQGWDDGSRDTARAYRKITHLPSPSHPKSQPPPLSCIPSAYKGKYHLFKTHLYLWPLREKLNSLAWQTQALS